MISPHMTALAISLAKRGDKISYITEISLSKERSETGWEIPKFKNFDLKYAKNKNDIKKIIQNSSKDSIHICQGFRNNGIIGKAQKLIRLKNLREWIILETINEKVFLGKLKKYIYRFIAKKNHMYYEAILSIGWNTRDWLIDCGFNKDKIFPFAYFLSNTYQKNNHVINKVFNFIFIGRLVSLKKVDLLIRALSEIKEFNFVLNIIGSGVEYNSLKKLSEKLIPNKVKWHGTKKISQIPFFLSRADCLVLPSKHDGWGAVISESLMCGTPVICSNSCGASEVVINSKFGGVFESGSKISLKKELIKILKKGILKQNSRNQISNWSRCIDSDSGSLYLQHIINSLNNNVKPTPPWL